LTATSALSEMHMKDLDLGRRFARELRILFRMRQ
jgi:hypothetical protein